MHQPSLQPKRAAGPPPPPPPAQAGDCDVCPFRQSRGPCGPGCTPEPWTLDHHLHHLVQTEARPGPPDAEGQRWAERRRTGKAMILCQCGWTTGMVDVADLPNPESLKAEHPNAWALT